MRRDQDDICKSSSDSLRYRYVVYLAKASLTYLRGGTFISRPLGDLLFGLAPSLPRSLGAGGSPIFWKKATSSCFLGTDSSFKLVHSINSKFNMCAVSQAVSQVSRQSASSSSRRGRREC